MSSCRQCLQNHIPKPFLTINPGTDVHFYIFHTSMQLDLSLDNGYLDNFDNKFSNKYDKNLKIEKLL
jgi:hypothetical protein